MKRSLNMGLIIGWSVLLGLSAGAKAWAHGVDVQVEMTQALAIEARFESGEPMAQATVTVYAPSDPATPWLIATTDDQGRFWFSPDPADPGNWEVTVRQAGHGDVVVIPVSESDATFEIEGLESESQPDLLQRSVMIASILWGCLGTALFFSKRST